MVNRLYRRIRNSAEAALTGQDLKAKVLRGGVWLGGGSVIEQMARFGRTMLLARLLAPEAFGTMAIALSCASVIDTLTDVGVREAVIQNPRGGEAKYLNAAWWLAMGRGLFLYALIVVLAPWISRFYGNSQLHPLLCVTLLSVVFGSALSPGANRAIKEMRFSQWAAINHGGAICGIAVTIGLSFVLRDVWALAIGYCSENAARCILSYAVCRSFPRLSWDRPAIRELLRFSKGMFGLSFLNLVFARADVFVLAKLYSPANLGLYTLAVYLVQTPTSFIMNILGQTLLPSLSEIQGNKERTSRILIKISSLILFLGIPVIVFMFLSGKSLLTVVYGSQYSGVAGPLLLGSCVAVINLLNGQITTVLYSMGLPQLHRRSVALMAVIMVAAIYPFSKWMGLVGGQVACLVAVVSGYVLQLERVSGLIDLNYLQYGRSFVLATLAPAVVLAIGLGTQSLGALDKPVANIAFGIAGCLAAYVCAYVVVFPGQRLFAQKAGL